MNKRIYPIYILIVCIALSLLSGCERPINPGEVARVNGKSISLKQLQSMHDQLAITADSPNRSTDELRQEYGAVLSELIIYELVEQELEKRGFSVTQEELDAFQAELKQGIYYEKDFEQIMLESSFDIDLWRQSLRRRLALEKFMDKVLRPTISISSKEVEDYYLSHEEDFKRPEKIHFIQFISPLREQLASAVEQFIQQPDVGAIQQRFDDVILRDVDVWVNRISPEQLIELKKLRPLEASPIMEMHGELFIMVPISREAPRVLGKTESYEIIEKFLLESKYQTAFSAWLKDKISKSTIKVSEHLLPEFKPDLRLFHRKVKEQSFWDKTIQKVKSW